MIRNRNKALQRLSDLLLILLFSLPFIALNAQSDKKFIRQGNKEFGKDNYSESEIYYRKAIDLNSQSPDAVFNIGDALYKQKKYEDASKQFIENANMNEDKVKKSAGLYNLGNTLLMSDKVKESIEAYKGSLKLDPDNIQTKYNLAYAQDLLKLQEQQQQQQQQQQDKDKQDQKEDQNKDDQNKDQSDKQDDQQKDQKQQQQEQSISKEDAQRLLNALANDEKDVQEKVKLAKAAKAKVKTLKNW